MARLFLALLVQGAVASLPPDREELLDKSSKELKAMLRTRGATCKKCVEKEHLADRLLDVWDWSALEAISPDGKIQITKDQFVKNLESSYRKHLSQQKEKKKAEFEGHQLASDDEDEDEDEDGEQMPDLDKVWADFSESLRKGEIKTDEKGNMIYEVGAPQGPQTWWDKYKTQVMLSANVVLLVFMQRARGKERETKNAEQEKQQGQQAVDNKGGGGGGGKKGKHKDKSN